ncbi:MAG: hypothetical protein EON51_02275 [Acinetobacter sp.]|nr:MAG: hypothetical protein EON51_02275 [Acinetobacter sp.]
MRSQLITVPSCQAHNQDTSLDDEYARNIITMSIENNQTSMDHFMDKSLSSFRRNGVLRKSIIDSLTDQPSYKAGAKSVFIERPRFDRIIRKVAYALFYKEYAKTWERLLAVATNQIKMRDMSNDHLGKIFDELSEDLNLLTLKGENPQIFQYSFIEYGEGEFDKALFMLFYEGFPFWIIPDANSTEWSFD